MTNPLYRYLHGKSKKTKVSVKRRKRSMVKMARRRRSSSRRSPLGSAGMGGLAKSALIGIGTAHLANYVPINVPYKEELAGAVGAYLIGGKNIKSAAVGAGAVFLTKMVSGQSTSGTAGGVSPY